MKFLFKSISFVIIFSLSSCVLKVENNEEIYEKVLDKNSLNNYENQKNNCEINPPILKPLPKLPKLTDKEMADDEIFKKILIDYIKTIKNSYNNNMLEYKKVFDEFELCQKE